MSEEWPIMRSQGVAPGRSSGAAYGNLTWAVATSDDKSLDLIGQATRSFSKLDRVLQELGTDKRYLLSVTVYLSNMSDKAAFDQVWLNWVGNDPKHWPQRACVGVQLSAGTLVELSIIAGMP